jgi:hypothetical protein
MALRSGATDGKARIAATTDLTTGAVGGAAVARAAHAGNAVMLVSAVVAMTLGVLLLTPEGMNLSAGVLHNLDKDLGDSLSGLPVPLAAIGVGLAMVMVFLAQAYRQKSAAAAATVPPLAAAEGGTVPAASGPTEPVEWVGEVTNVGTLTRGSLEVYGEEMVSDLLVIDNISPLKVRKLEGIGIRSRSDLLRIGRSQLGRQDIARRTGIGVRQLTDWLNKADLMRIEGLTMGAIRLLEVAGIETIEDLAVARPEAIERKLREFGKRQTPNVQLPDLEQLTQWVDGAGQLVS